MFCVPHRYMEIPIISRIYFTSAFLTTAGCAMDIISPYSLYFNFDLIFFEGQIWRLFSSFMFFGIFLIAMVAPLVQVHNFLGSALTFMMTYVWGRRNEDVRMSVFGLITFKAPYLPWVMLSFSLLFGNPVSMDVIGIF